MIFLASSDCFPVFPFSTSSRFLTITSNSLLIVFNRYMGIYADGLYSRLFIFCTSTSIATFQVCGNFCDQKKPVDASSMYYGIISILVQCLVIFLSSPRHLDLVQGEWFHISYIYQFFLPIHSSVQELFYLSLFISVSVDIYIFPVTIL